MCLTDIDLRRKGHLNGIRSLSALEGWFDFPLNQGTLYLSTAPGGAGRWNETTSAGGDALGPKTARRHQFFDTLFMAARAFGVIVLGRQYQAFKLALAVAAPVFIKGHGDLSFFGRMLGQQPDPYFFPRLEA
jgi:hypothetical protein